MTIDEVLHQARAGLRRLTAPQASAAMREGALVVDIRPEFQRRVGGEIPGAIVVERLHLEWRCDPASGGRRRVRGRARAHPVPEWTRCESCSSKTTSGSRPL